MRLDPVLEVGVHYGLGSRANRNWFCELPVAALCDPGNLRREALDVILLPLQLILRDEHREVGVVDIQSNELVVEPTLHDLPHLVTPRPEDVATADVIVGQHLGEDNDVGVPSGEVLLLLMLQRQKRILLSSLLLLERAFFPQF